MADTKISALPAVTTPAATDEFAVNQGAVSKKVTANQLGLGHVYDVKAAPYNALGNDSNDDTAEIQAAIDAAYAAGGGTVFIPAGIYRIGSASIQLKSNVRLLGAGPATVLKQTAAEYVIEAAGSLASGTALSANGTEHAQSVSTGTSNPNLVAGDVVLIRDTQYAFSTTGRNQELNRVVSVAGTNPYVVTLSNGLISSYLTASSAEIIKVTGANSTVVESLTLLVPSGTNGGGFYYNYVYDALVKDVHVSGAYYASIGFYNSGHVAVRDCVVRDGQNLSGSNGYGLMVNDSTHNGSFTGNLFERVRENMFAAAAKVHLFANNVMRNNYDDGVNTHGQGCSRIVIANNIVSGTQAGAGILVSYGSASAADWDVSIIGNLVENTTQDGIVISGSSGKVTHDVLVEGNTIRRWGTRAQGSDMAIYVAAGSAAYVTDVTIKGNMIHGEAGLSEGRAIRVTGGSDIMVEGNQIVNVHNNYGIQVDGTSTRVSIVGNSIKGASSSNIYTSGTNNDILVQGNRTDDTDYTKGTATEAWRDNYWGTKHSRNYGSAAVSTGGTIAHGLVTTPVAWHVQPIAATPTAIYVTADATNLTVTFSGGGSQTFKWWAEV